ncbi:hypothetical protein ACIHCV_26495 [Streptomyces sp. NPDC051956]
MARIRSAMVTVRIPFRYWAGTALADRYFADRTDGLRPASGEDLLVATA